MKLSKLAPICKGCHSIYIRDQLHGGTLTQWAGDGAAFYSLDGMPVFSPETLFVALGFDIDKKDCWILGQEPMNESILNAEMTDGSDAEMNFDQKASLMMKGKEIIIGYAAGKAYFFNWKYFTPLKMDENFSAVIRKVGANEILVTKDGMFPTAMIAPLKLQDDFKSWLENLLKKM